jgi:phospholipase A1
MAAAPRTLAECAQIEDDAERLAAYDELAGRTKKAPSTPATPVAPVTTRSETRSSYLSQLWDLDAASPQERFSVLGHRSNYLLPFTYNASPNEEPILEATGEEVRDAEIAFQLSGKVLLFQDVLFDQADIWFAYTQRSFWQAYNFDDSSPFRETNYEPELLLSVPVSFRFLGLDARMLVVGLNHQSNGRSEPLSKSWNRVMGTLGLERGHLTVLLNGWYRIPESSSSDDNPDIEDYLGNGELWVYYTLGRQRFGVMLRNNLDFHDNHGAVQVEWSYPIHKRINFYVQGFTGYGESLVDYDHRVSRVSIGFLLRDWD